MYGPPNGYIRFEHEKRACKNGFKNLNDDQKAGRKEFSAEMLERLEIEPDFLTSAITGDENCFFEYDPETKRQSEDWHTPQSPRKKKVRMSKPKCKTMLIISLYSRGQFIKNLYYLVSQ
jgi:hypothetical protein